MTVGSSTGRVNQRSAHCLNISLNPPMPIRRYAHREGIDIREKRDDAMNEQFQVVLNDEEQYSIWPVGRELPAGWRPEGLAGDRAECLAHIDRVWTDMRPRSVRRHAAANV
jgi:MbtH protein